MAMSITHKVVNKRLANLIAEHGTTIIKTATVAAGRGVFMI